MRIVFMGTPEFAVPALEALASAYGVCAVYTRPDAVSGRGKKLRPSPVKERALSLGLEVLAPATLRDAAAIQELAALDPDMVVVAAYGVILPAEVLAIPRYGCINIHGSLLPRWRGAAPIQRAILAGDEQTGVTIMRMEEGLDTGDFCASITVEIAEKNTEELTQELAAAGAQLLLKVLPSIVDGSAVWQVQDEAGATYADRIFKQDVMLSPQETAHQNHLYVRASNAAAPAKVCICDKAATVLAAHEADSGLSAGEVAFESGQVLLGCVQGTLVVDRIKPDGKNAMDGSAWMTGLRDAPRTWGRL